MMFSFVTRNGEDILQEVLLPCGGSDRPLEDHPCDPGAFGHRVVFGFFEGQFTADEVNRFMQDLASAPGSAPMANNYFKSYNEDSRVNTGGISFEKICVSLRGSWKSLRNTATLSSLTNFPSSVFRRIGLAH